MDGRLGRPWSTAVYAPRVARWVRVGAAGSAVFWAVFFFGVVDLSVIANPGEFEPVVALEASWGVLFTFFVAGSLAAAACDPRVAPAAAVQLVVVAVALLAGAILGSNAELLPVAAVLAGTAAVLLGTNRAALPGAFRWAPHWPGVAVAIVAAPAWLWYAGWSFGNSRGPGAESDVTRGIDHWPVHGATAVAICAASVVASVWPRGRRLLATTTCLAGTVLGAASLAYPTSAGAMPSRAWSFAAILWSLTVGLLVAGAQKLPLDIVRPGVERA